MEGYTHETVNHQENYVDPFTGAHSQAIERSWLDAKIKILKKIRGVPLTMLQSHLDVYSALALRCTPLHALERFGTLKAILHGAHGGLSLN